MFRFNKFVMLATICLSVFAVVLSGCGSSKGSKEASGDKSLTFANTTDISSMDPRNANSTAMATILSYLYNGLLTTDENGNVIPDLAESYKQVDATTGNLR